MVDTIEAYTIVNRAVLQVANDMVILDAEIIEDKPYQIRLEETPFSIAECRQRLDGTVVVAHDLQQYVNKFYSIMLDASDKVWLDYLIDYKVEDIDLTEFGEYL